MPIGQNRFHPNPVSIYLILSVISIRHKDINVLRVLIAMIFDVTVYPKKYAHGFCFAVLCCGYTLTDFPISVRLTLLALWQSNDCPSASKATLMNMDKYFMWIHYGRLHNHNKAKHNKTVCIFLGIYCTTTLSSWNLQQMSYVLNFYWNHATKPLMKPCLLLRWLLICVQIKKNTCNHSTQLFIITIIFISIAGPMKKYANLLFCHVRVLHGIATT